MERKVMIVALLAIVIVSGIGYASAESHEPELAFSEFQIVVLGIGALAGFVTAYNQYVKNKREQGDKFVFDRSAFFDRFFMAVLGSIPLAIAESANVVKLDIFGAWIIFAAALGTGELILEIRTRNKTKKTV